MVTKKSTSDKKNTARKSIRRTTDAGTNNKKRRTGARKFRKKKKKIAINIRRSSGRKEKFDVDRMTQTTSRSGVPFMMARDISKNISKKISSEAEDSKKEERTVTADRVRNMIAKELRKRNEKTIASSYAGEVPVNRQSEYASQKIGGQYSSPIGSAHTDQHEAYRADADSVVHDKSKRHQSST